MKVQSTWLNNNGRLSAANVKHNANLIKGCSNELHLLLALSIASGNTIRLGKLKHSCDKSYESKTSVQRSTMTDDFRATSMTANFGKGVGHDRHRLSQGCMHIES